MLPSHVPPQLPVLPGMAFQIHLSESNNPPLGTPSIFSFPSTPSCILLGGSRVPLLCSGALYWHVCYGDDKLSVMSVSVSLSLTSIP